MWARLVGVVIALTTIVAGTCLAHPGDEPRDPGRIYTATCHYCHDIGIGPPLKGAHFPTDRIRDTVRHGHNAMIAFSPSEISDSELEALARMLSEAPAPQAVRAGQP